MNFLNIFALTLKVWRVFFLSNFLFRCTLAGCYPSISLSRLQMSGIACASTLQANQSWLGITLSPDKKLHRNNEQVTFFEKAKKFTS